MQSEIVRILDSFTELTDELANELAARKKQYEHYREKILDFKNPGCFLSKMLRKLCPEGVGYKTVDLLVKEKIVTLVTPSIKVNKDVYGNNGLVPIISQEAEFISGYCDTKDGNIGVGKYVCFGDHTEHLKYVDFPFVQGADGLKILKIDESGIIPKYFYFALSQFYKKHNNYERHFKYLGKTSIPIPPLPVQEEIVRILDRFDTLCNDLTSGLPAEIESRRKQYEHYRDRLLDFPRRDDSDGDRR